MLDDFYRPLEERVSRLPGVKAAGLINLLPIERFSSHSKVDIAGQPPSLPNQEFIAENRMVSSGYFNAMGIPIDGGRSLSSDIDNGQKVGATVAVSEAFVREVIPAELNLTTQHIDDAGSPEQSIQIVGVTGNVRQNIYEPSLAERDWLMDEMSPKLCTDLFSNMYLLVLTTSNPMAQVGAVQEIIHDQDLTVPFDQPRTMTGVLSEQLVSERMEAWLFGIFAGLTLMFALVGIFGLVRHDVKQSTQDIGVRMALEATRYGILKMLLDQVGQMLCVGAVTGIILIVVTRKFIGMIIYFDLRTEMREIVCLALLLVITGLISVLMPAFRASSIEPTLALRTE
jgi:hypothetical protein